MSTFFKKYAIETLLIGLVFVAILPLFQSGFFPIHDDEQVGRLFQLHKALVAWHIPPRITPDLGFGYGYPLFNFYPPFVYYVAEVFHLVGFSYIDSIKLMIGSGFFLSALFMYLFTKEYAGKIGGLVASVLYTYAPYHAVDVYVRGALPEFWSFVFIPAIFWSYKKMSEVKHVGTYFILSSIFTAFLILTHNLVAMMNSIFIGVYVLFLLLTVAHKKHFFAKFVGSIIFGFSLSAYFWIPAFFEKKHTMVELLTTELADYRNHFVYIRQLWDSAWGYGGSLYGLYDGLSFEIGKLHIILVVIGIILLFYMWQKKQKHYNVLLVFLLLFAIAAFMCTFYTAFIWESIRPLGYIQFPWRFLLFSAFTSSFVGGFLFSLNSIEEKTKIVLASFVMILTIFLYKGYFKPSAYLLEAKDSDYTSEKILRFKTSAMAFEYVPRGIAMVKSPVGNTVVDIKESEVAKKSYEVVKGNIDVTVLEDIPQRKTFAISSKTGGVLRINTFSFPGWKVYRNTEEIGYNDNNKFKLITVNLQEGDYTVTAKFTNTFYRTFGNLLSLGSVIFLFVLVVVNKRFLYGKT